MATASPTRNTSELDLDCRRRISSGQAGILRAPGKAELNVPGKDGAFGLNSVEPDGQTVRDELEKILYSGTFHRSERLRCFLKFIVENWLKDRRGKVKEYHIGTEVYGRPTSFDPRVDPIVRVEARRLRTKLKEYYRAEGRGDALEISLPSGSYVPAIASRPGAAGMLDFFPRHASMSVAVERFADFGATAEESDFSRGLMEEMLNALYAERLCVYVWHPSCRERELFRCEETRQPPAYSLLQGSIRWCGEHVRISARLTTTEDHALIWSQVYSQTTGEQMALQESIAAAVASAVRNVIENSRSESCARGAFAEVLQPC